MNSAEEKKLLEILDINREILQFFPELLADIWILGSWPDRIIDLLKTLSLPKNTEVIELGCGKGAVAIQVAEQLKFTVTGIDLYEPFLDEANEKVVEHKVEHLCKFIKEDFTAFIEYNKNLYDVIILAGVGSIGNSIQQTIFNLRKLIRSKGYMIFDDGFLSGEDTALFPGYEYYCNHTETVKQLTSCGDKIIKEVIVPVKVLKEYNENNNLHIKKRADRIMAKFSNMKKHLEDYIQKEKNECEFLETKTIPAVWLLQKNDR